MADMTYTNRMKEYFEQEPENRDRAAYIRGFRAGLEAAKLATNPDTDPIAWEEISDEMYDDLEELEDGAQTN